MLSCQPTTSGDYKNRMIDNIEIHENPFRGLGQRAKGDKVIWAAVIVLALVSLLVVYSATGSLAYKLYKGRTEVYLFKQFAFISLGIIVIYFAHRVNYTLYARVAKIIFLLSIPLLLYTLFFGVKLNEGSRWIRLPVINLTPKNNVYNKSGIDNKKIILATLAYKV